MLLRKPYQKKYKIKPLFLIFVSGLLLFYFFYAVLGPLTRVSSIKFSADKQLKSRASYIKKEPDILSYLNEYKGKNLWQVNLKTLVTTLNELYFGAEVYVIRKWPNRLIVFLKPKATALILLKNKEVFYPVSYEGEIGDSINLKDFFDFPILRGKVFWNDLSLRKQVLSVLSSIPKKGEGFSIQNISEILYNKKNNSLMFYLIPGHFTVELQASSVSPKKIKNINFVLTYLSQRDHQGELIDARFPKKIIVKRIN